MADSQVSRTIVPSGGPPSTGADRRISRRKAKDSRSRCLRERLSIRKRGICHSSTRCRLTQPLIPIGRARGTGESNLIVAQKIGGLRYGRKESINPPRTGG